ncbi:hypothetical protein OS187_13330, partial [Xanthomonadaceae bacterium JHOS43]|nr:hypothetical protein [Xanthomonadaceae bacterium JHOS43]
KLDAITTDDDGKSYMFAGALYMRLDTERDGLHSFSITRQWKEVQTGVDAAFSYDHKIYLIKDDNVFIYKGAAPYTLVEGYPKTLKEELGVEGHVDAAFVCPAENTVHIIQGTNLVDVDLSATPRAITKTTPLPIADIDAGSCDSHGVNVYKGHHFYHYESATTLAMSKIAPMPQDITHAMMACQE